MCSAFMMYTSRDAEKGRRSYSDHLASGRIMRPMRVDLLERSCAIAGMSNDDRGSSQGVESLWSPTIHIRGCEGDMGRAPACDRDYHVVLRPRPTRNGLIRREGPDAGEFESR